MSAPRQRTTTSKPGGARNTPRAYGPWYVTIVRAGTVLPEHLGHEPEDRPAFADDVLNAAMTVRRRDAAVAALARQASGHAMLVAARGHKWPETEAVEGEPALRNELRALLDRALNDALGGAMPARAEAVVARHKKGGQVRAVVVVVRDESLARELGQEMSESVGSGKDAGDRQRAPRQERVARLKSLLEESPATGVEFAALRGALREFNDLTRQELADRAEAPLNAWAQQQPQSTYEEKKSLAKSVNGELRLLGLAIRCPRTGTPSLLLGNPGHNPVVGRFMLGHTDSLGRSQHTLTSVVLPHLTLMPDDLSRGPSTERSRKAR